MAFGTFPHVVAVNLWSIQYMFPTRAGVMQRMLFWTTLLKKMLRLDNAAADRFSSARSGRVLLWRNTNHHAKYHLPLLDQRPVVETLRLPLGSIMSTPVTSSPRSSSLNTKRISYFPPSQHLSSSRRTIVGSVCSLTGVPLPRHLHQSVWQRLMQGWWDSTT